jgi:hypothetical protein
VSRRGSVTRSGTRRLGDDYQDLVAIEVLVDWLEHTGRYEWIRVEADDVGALDDVVAQRSDGTLVLRQVKHATYPESPNDPWTWEDLLNTPTGTSGNPRKSLLQKWSDAVAQVLNEYTLTDAAVVSNRQGAADLVRSLSQERFVDLDQVEPEVRATIIQQLGDEARAREILHHLRFELDRPSREELEDGLRRRFFNLGGTDAGWQNIKETVRLWVVNRLEPPPDGAITLEHVRLAARWKRLDPLPQQFEIPDDYVIPSQEWYSAFLRELRNGSRDCIVLAGNPGIGKSTYISYLYQELRDSDVPALRHHYFLSLRDRSQSIRLDHQRAAESLMSDLHDQYCSALQGLDARNPDPSDLRTWLEQAGAHFAALDTRLIVFVDGLDHIWRERKSIHELDRLLAYILPAPEGVIVVLATQPVSDDLLPSILHRHAPRSTWWEMPLLDEISVSAWVRKRARDLVRTDDSVPDHVIDRIAHAFYQVSGGHPLHLHYGIRALLEQGHPVTEETISQLPGCPHNDIVQYYQALWRDLPEEGREITHLMTACPIPWPRAGLVSCLDPEGARISAIMEATRKVEHLLRTDQLGLRPFHSSLPAFIDSLPDHEIYARKLKQRALDWLQSSAPEPWRWAHEWTLAADLGDEQPLVSGPNREWAIEALASRHDREDVETILSRAINTSLGNHDLPRAIDLGLLSSYWADVHRFEDETLERLLAAQLIANDDEFLRRRLQARLEHLRDGELALLAEAEAQTGHHAGIDRCFQELRERLRTPRSPETERTSGSWSTQVTPLLTTMALTSNPAAQELLRFAAINRENGLSAGILSIFGSQLRRNRDINMFRTLLRDPPGVGPVTDNGDLEEHHVELLPDERDALVRHAVLLALEEQLDVSDLLDSGVPPSDPFASIYSVLRCQGQFAIGPVDFPNADVLSTRRYSPTDGPEQIRDWFHDLFFRMLANHFAGHPDCNHAWLDGADIRGWAGQFARHLELVAGELAGRIQYGLLPTFGWFYQVLKGLPRPKWPGGDSALASEHGHAAAAAALRIGLDILAIRGSGASPSITVDDLKEAFDSGYCEMGSWLEPYIARRRRLLTDEALQWLINDDTNQLATVIEPGDERAMRLSELAAVVAFHGWHEQARQLIREACSNLLTHGSHKDLLLTNALETVRVYHQHIRQTPSLHEEVPKLRRMLADLATPIAAVGEFTDGDETGHLPTELAEVLGEAAPEGIPSYFRWLQNKGEDHDALSVFHVYLKSADLTLPANRALAKTALDPKSREILAQRAEEGDEIAQEALDSITELTGPVAPESPRRDEKSPMLPIPDRDEPPAPERYPPDRFDDYLNALRPAFGFNFESELGRWITIWVSSDYAIEVLQALEKAAERGERLGSYDAIFDLALRLQGREYAYRWLLRGYDHHMGWLRYFSRKEYAIHWWEIVTRHYPERWLDFITETLIYDRPWSTPMIDHHSWVRLVEFCLLMNQPTLAGRLVDRMVDDALDLVEPFPLPVPLWTGELRA